MNRFFAVVFASAGVSLSIVHSAIALSGAEVNEIVKGVTVRIKSSTSSGSGVLIRKNGGIYTVLTAAHVLSPGETYEVLFADGQHYLVKADTIQKHTQFDLAIAQFCSNSLL